MEDTEKLVSLINNLKMEESKENKEKNTQAIIEAVDFGPLKITGNFIIKDMKKGTEVTQKEVWLCRCGKSSNKPYCDESHKK